MTSTRILFFAALLLLLQACQYPVDSSSLPDAKRFLVIDAELTENYGKINVTYTLNEVTAQGGYLFPKPPKAVAYVVDSQGNQTYFNTDGTRDNSFHGVVGETYKLYVEVEGQLYESLAETMRACPEIDLLSPIYTRENSRSPDDFLYDGFDVYTQFTDIAGQENFYQWDWIHYERQAACDRIVEAGTMVQVPCTPYDCWSIAYNTRVIVQSDKLRDGQPLAQKIVRVPYATPPSKYYLRVEQRSITPSVFTYLQSLQIQTQNVGSMFDIPAQTQFNPNVHNINNPTEQILGAFNVFSYRRKIIYVDMTQKIDGTKPKIYYSLPFTSQPLLQAPCTENYYRTQVKPEGWQD